MSYAIAIGATRIAMTISSSDAFPARSPMPLIVHSTWRAPRPSAARRVRDREAKIVVAMDGDRDLLDSLAPARERLDQTREFLGIAVADGVGNVHRGRSRVDHRLQHLAQEIRIGSRRIFRRKLHVAAKRLREPYRSRACSRHCSREIRSLYFR